MLCLQFSGSKSSRSTPLSSPAASGTVSRPKEVEDRVILIKEEPLEERATVITPKGKTRAKSDDDDSMIMKVRRLSYRDKINVSCALL